MQESTCDCSIPRLQSRFGAGRLPPWLSGADLFCPTDVVLVTDPRSQDVCSAKGCQLPATWALLWNNPKLHTPDRRKTWLACDDHRDSLSDFLAARNFLKEVVEHR